MLQKHLQKPIAQPGEVQGESEQRRGQAHIRLLYRREVQELHTACYTRVE